jgi:ferric-dicitrate binding protein FerR (iron transport regulator)
VNNQYYNDLFERLLDGRLSPEETDQLLEWLHRDDTAGEAASLIAARLNRLVTEDEITPEIRSALQARLPLILNAEKRQKRLVPLFRQTWFRYAAAAVLIIAVGISFWSIQQKTTPASVPAKPVVAKTDITPGKQGAILTLADGRQVVLDSLGNGVIADQSGAQVQLQDGKLLYSALPTDDARVTFNEISTPKGRQFQLILPDGTKVWLNAASSLKYPTQFNGKERRVEITGEAYFEVAKNAAVPFYVNINHSTTVKVLGTHFNINAYSDEPTIKTTLLEGRVEVTKEKSQVILKPGEQAICSGNSRFTIDHSPDIDKTMAWKNGVFNFNDATLQEVMHQLERWYDIEVQYETGIPNLVFVGKMGRDLSLNNVLRGLELSKVHFRLEGRKLVVLP